MKDNIADIRVIGVGGGGCNAINKMISSNVEGATFYAVNTDAQALNASLAKIKVPLGALGAGANPEIGKKSAREHFDEIKKALTGADMVYITAGMGGGTGTGAAPVIAEASKELGILTIAIVTTPFNFEGPRRNTQAMAGIKELEKHVDSLIIVSNDKLLQTVGNMPLTESFAYADAVLKKGVSSVVDIIQSSSLINLDFADVKSIMTNAGNAMIGIGEGKGKNRAIEAAKNALNCPLLEINPKGATKAIINVAGGKDMSIQDAYEAVEYIKSQTNSNLDTIFGVSVLEGTNDDNMVVTIVLTGLVNSDPVLTRPKADVAIQKEDIIGFAKTDLPKPIKPTPKVVQDDEPRVLIAQEETEPTFTKPVEIKMRRRAVVDEKGMDSFFKRLNM